MSEKEDVKKLVEELKDLMDGPDPEEVDELLKMPPIVAICEHCRSPVTLAPGSVEQHQFLTISEPVKNK